MVAFVARYGNTSILHKFKTRDLPMYAYSRRKREMVYATSFAAFLALFVIFLVTLSFVSAGPIVLGTELNPNGTTEYLCLGRGCENLLAMDW